MVRGELMVRQMNIGHLTLVVQIIATEQVQSMSIMMLLSVEYVIDQVRFIFDVCGHFRHVVQIVDRMKGLVMG